MLGRYDIEAHWTLNLICNFSCTYCFSSAPKDVPLTAEITPQRCVDFFDATGKTWLLHLTGGEPFFHRHFVDLCAALSAKHWLSLNTNLSSNKVAEFAKKIDPGRVDSIHVGVHLEERTKRNNWPMLLENAGLLVQAGFPVYASAVMTPAAFPLFQDASARLAAVGVPLFPKALRAVHEGKRFPESYTAGERAEFIRLLERAMLDADANPYRPLRHQPSIDLSTDRYFLDTVRDFTGVQCSAGRKFVTIGPDGNVYECGDTHRIGNIFKGTLKLRNEDRPCRSQWCHYACVRYSAHDAAGSQVLPSEPVQLPAAARIGNFIHWGRRGIANRLVQVSLR